MGRFERVRRGGAAALKALEKLSEAAAEAAGAKDAIDAAVDELIPGEGEVDPVLAAAQAAAAAAAAAQAAAEETRDNALAYEPSDAGTFWADVKGIYAIVEQGFGIVDKFNPNADFVTTRELRQDTGVISGKCNSILDAVFMVQEQLKALAAYPLNDQGVALFLAHQAAGRITGEGLIVLLDGEAPVIDPRQLTFLAGDGHFYPIGGGILADVLGTLNLYPRP